jgi:hypothetical protein
MFVITAPVRLPARTHQRQLTMTYVRLGLVFMLLLVAGCDGPFRTPWHDVKLASGDTIRVTSFNLVWGAEHDEHTLGKDCFAIEYVSAQPDSDTKAGEAEAAAAFELVRPASEQWGFREATVAAIPTLEHRGPYDLYWYQRQPDGHWSSKAIVRKGVWIQNAMSDPWP